jgi:hypothetical protein
MVKTAAALLYLSMTIWGAAGGTVSVLDGFPKSVRSMGLGGIKAAPLLWRSEGTYEASSKVLTSTADYTGMQARLPFGDDFYFLGAGFRPHNRVSFRAYWSHLAGTDVELTSYIDSITDADTVAYKVDGTINVSDHVAAAIVQVELFDSIFTGFAIKWIKEGEGEFKTDVISSDAGITVTGVTKNLSAAVLLRNCFAKGQNYRELRVGTSWSGYGGRAALYGECGALLIKKSSIESVVALEWKVNRFLEARTGVNWLSEKRTPDLAVGFSFLLKGFYLDYALVTKPELGLTGGHRISCGYSIGGECVE